MAWRRRMCRLDEKEPEARLAAMRAACAHLLDSETEAPKRYLNLESISPMWRRPSLPSDVVRSFQPAVF